MQRFRQFIYGVLAALALAFSVVPALPATTYAVNPGQTACDAVSCDAAPGPSLSKIIKTVVSILSLILGFIAVIMIIIAGLKYVTSGGDASSVSSAKNTIIYALVGLVVAASAQIIVRYVLGTIK